MHTNTASNLTELLNLGLGGDREAGERAFTLVYDELRRRAAQQLNARGDHATLTPTALVNEIYIRLSSGSTLALNDRAHFFALSARAMRTLLIDRQRLRASEKHGGSLQRIELDENLLDETQRGINYLDLDKALVELATVDERAARVVELHFFAGLNFMEIAELLALSDKTVRRDWISARAFLLQALP
jgi:RNA polymerase sigma factor (TIGR02999 family)